MNLYNAKRILLFPYIRHMRQRERHTTGFLKAVLELHYYRPAIYAFIRATARNPDILYEAPDIRENSIVLDVGGFSGEWSARVFEKYRPILYCFEPEPGAVQRIRDRFRGKPNIHCLAYGLGRKNASLRLMRKGMGATFYADAGKAADRGAPLEVPVRDIAEVFEELGLKRIDLLKLNIEGGEYDVLERLIETDRLKDIGCLMVQFHEWLNGSHRRRRRIHQALRKQHRLVWNYPFVWEQWVLL